MSCKHSHPHKVLPGLMSELGDFSVSSPFRNLLWSHSPSMGLISHSPTSSVLLRDRDLSQLGIVSTAAPRCHLQHRHPALPGDPRASLAQHWSGEEEEFGSPNRPTGIKQTLMPFPLAPIAFVESSLKSHNPGLIF